MSPEEKFFAKFLHDREIAFGFSNDHYLNCFIEQCRVAPVSEAQFWILLLHDAKPLVCQKECIFVYIMTTACLMPHASDHFCRSQEEGNGLRIPPYVLCME